MPYRQKNRIIDRQTKILTKKKLFFIYIPCKRLSVYKRRASLKPTIIFDIPILSYVVQTKLSEQVSERIIIFTFTTALCFLLLCRVCFRFYRRNKIIICVLNIFFYAIIALFLYFARHSNALQNICVPLKYSHCMQQHLRFCMLPDGVHTTVGYLKIPFFFFFLSAQNLLYC